jgi:hypothetical protein
MVHVGRDYYGLIIRYTEACDLPSLRRKPGTDRLW